MSCGPGTIGDILVPDTIFGVRITKCCSEHDKSYEHPEGRTRAEIDRAFLHCCLVSVIQAKPPRLGRALARAWVYYAAVRAGGWISWAKCRRRDNATNVD